MLKLEVVITSTRPGRSGLPIGTWVYNFAQQDTRFDVALADLAKINLPFLDEPKHPRFQDYQHDHTKKWSARITEADAFLFILPEYNYSMPAPFVNAIDFLSKEWKYKAAGFVTYGGVSAGTRALQMAKQLVTAVGMMPITEAVNLPFHTQFIKDEAFQPTELIEASAKTMLDEVFKWATALKTIRA